MISALNLRRLLSGNKWMVYIHLAMYVLVASCSAGHKIAQAPPPPAPKENSKPEVYNPATGRYETANAKNTKVDTISWKESAREPYLQDKTIPSDTKGDPTRRYQIALLLPLTDDDNGKDISVEGSEKYFHYYAGLKMGLERIRDSSYNLDVHVIDLKPSMDAIKAALKDPRVEQADLLMGPLRRDQINETAKFAKERDIPMVTPWNSYRTIENLSSNYILLKSSLPTHCEVLSKYILTQAKPSDICLVGREKSKTLMNYFQNEMQRSSGTALTIPRSIVKDDYKFTDEYKYLDTTRSVYIVTEFDEPEIVLNFLRHINQMRRNREVTVIGMPSWLDYNRDFTSLFSQLNVLISSTTFIDVNDDAVAAFRKSFFKQYQNFPLKEAYEGYDGIQYLAKMLSIFGKGFNYYGDMYTYDGLATSFKLEKIIDLTKPIDDRLYSSSIQCIENKALHILKFDQYRFSKIQ